MRSAGRPLIFGEVLFDRFPDGQAILGGAPFNVAWNLQALGERPLLITRVGRNQLGEEILAAMTRWGMDTAGVQIDPQHATGIVEITVRDGEPEYDIALGKAYDYIAADGLPARIEGSLLYHGSLALRTDPPRDTLEALRRHVGCPALMDVNLRAPWWDRATVLDGLAAARWGKLNEGELAELVPEPSDPAARARRLLQRGDTEALIVTRGEAGARIHERDGAVHELAAGAPRPVVDTVGAGDAFAAVVLLGLLRGWNWPLALERADAFAGAVVGLRGATTDDRRFYERIQTDWEKS